MLFALNFRFIFCKKEMGMIFPFLCGGGCISELSCFDISNCMMDVKCIANGGDN